MKIYSRHGDKGETFILTGKKLSKNDILIHFLGAADELNAHLGLVKALLCDFIADFAADKAVGKAAGKAADAETLQFIENIQINIMMLMSHAGDAANSQYVFCEEDIKVLENEIDKLMLNVKEANKFVIPGKNVIEAQIHIARTAARKAERLFAAINEKRILSAEAGAYLNRLSDYLFVLSQQEF